MGGLLGTAEARLEHNKCLKLGLTRVHGLLTPMMRKINSYLDGIGLGSASDGEAKGKEASLALKGDDSPFQVVLLSPLLTTLNPLHSVIMFFMTYSKPTNNRDIASALQMENIFISKPIKACPTVCSLITTLTLKHTHINKPRPLKLLC